MNFKERFQNARGVVSVIMIIIGILLIVWPGHTLAFLAILVGWGLIISGAAAIFYGLFGFSLVSPASLIGGIASVIIGIVFVRAPSVLIAIIPIIIGIFVIINAIYNLHNAWVGRNAYGYSPSRDYVINAIMLVLGILILIFPLIAANVAVVLIGVALVYNGIANFITRWRENR